MFNANDLNVYTKFLALDPKSSVSTISTSIDFLTFVLLVLNQYHLFRRQMLYPIKLKTNNIKFFYPLIILFIPIFDMVFVVISRIMKGKSPFYPDRNHLHHRILNIGFSHKKTVLIILILHFSICLTLPLSLIFYK